jgi:signal transduction histidine kinase
MKQVFMNIILNSIQAMPEGGSLTVKCHYHKESHLAQVEISDTGTGMSQEVLANAFEPFFSTKPDGTGLGLSNVRKIIELHGGNIRLESAEGQGTKAIIALGVSS